MNCLESNSSETLANLVDKVNYKYEEMFSEIHFVDPSVKGPILGKSDYIYKLWMSICLASSKGKYLANGFLFHSSKL